MMTLAKYYFTIQHRPGRKMEHADYLSRIHNVQGPTERMDAKFILVVTYDKEGIWLNQQN